MITELETAENSWTIEDAAELYLVNRWGSGYFSINDRGEVAVSPLQESGRSVTIIDILNEARAQGLRTPLLIRFQDLLRHRVVTLNEAFCRAIQESGYGAEYRGVFPIKVNQLREVVEEILDAGSPYHYGIEAGSKPELFAAMSLHTDSDSLIVCNGYKDEHFIRTAMLGRKLGKKVIVVCEKLSEVRAIIKVASDMNVEPLIGIRVRLQSEGEGIWKTSGGEHAKFGLSTLEMLEAIELLREAGMESCFKLLHFHIGSQIPDILSIKRAVREASRFYTKLHLMGHKIEYLDVGGGLAVDYDGSKSTFHSSMNYTIQEYANDIIYNVIDICDEEEVPHPTIVSESGRAIVAHHSVLVVQAFGSIEKTPFDRSTLKNVDHKLVDSLLDIESDLTVRNLNESWHDLIQIKEEAQKMFEVGVLDLEAKACIEALYWHLGELIEKKASQLDLAEIPEYLDDLRQELADQHICNFSVFQSLLDHWALGQLFPIMPIHRLDEPPDSDSTLVDITCDSDGKISKFIDISDVRRMLPLHDINDKPYYLGVFLTGAYQDIMGDIHNLFGRVNEVHVFVDEEEESGFYIEESFPGNTIGEVLSLTQYDTRDLAREIKRQVDRAIKENRIKPSDGMKLLAEFEKGLTDQTYLTFDNEQ